MPKFWTMPLKERDKCFLFMCPFSIDCNLGMTVGVGAVTVDQSWESCSTAHLLTACDRDMNSYLGLKD